MYSNQKIGVKMIKVWAFIYRLTGWYCPLAKLAEYRYIKTQWRSIQKSYHKPDNDMSFEDHVGLKIGMWQAHHGFYRKLSR